MLRSDARLIRSCVSRPITTLERRRYERFKPHRTLGESACVLAVLYPPRSGQPLADLSGPGRQGTAPSGPSGAVGRDPEASEARAHRRHSHRNGRRFGSAFRGLPRAAQPVTRAGQGWGALSPECHARRSDGAVGLDDHQERRRGFALWRRQGGHSCRAFRADAQRAGAPDPTLHQ